MTEVTAQAAPDPSLPDAVLGRRALERLDLLLLTVEALDLNGGEGHAVGHTTTGLRVDLSQSC